MEIKSSEQKEILVFGKGNQNAIFCGSSGHGKSLADERVRECLLNGSPGVPKSKIACLDIKGKLESAFAMFFPEDELHLGKLSKQLVKDSGTGKVGGEGLRRYKVRIIHPFTFGLPDKKIPRMDVFFIPLSSVHEEELQFLLESTSEQGATFKLLNNALGNLRKGDGLYHFMHRVQDLSERLVRNIGGKSVRVGDPKRFFLKGVSGGDILKVDEVTNLFLPFEKDYFLSNHDYDLNIDLLSLLNRQDEILVLSTKYLVSNKLKDFVNLWFLRQILRLSDDCKYRIIVDIDEIRMLLPRRPLGYKKSFSYFVKDFLAINRTFNISVLAQTQTLGGVSDEVREVFTDIFLGRVSGADECKFLGENLKFNKEEILSLQMCDRGMFLHLGLRDYSFIRILFPCHAHKEEYEVFEKRFAREFPDKMVSFRDLKKRVRSELVLVHEFFRERDEREIKKLVEFERSKKEEEVVRKERVEKLEEFKLKRRDEIKKSKSDRDDLIFRVHLDNPKFGYRLISKKLEEDFGLVVSHTLVSRVLLRKRLGASKKNGVVNGEEEA